MRVAPRYASSAGFSLRRRPADELDRNPEKPQPGVDGTPPRMNAEFVECAGVFIDEFETRRAGSPPRAHETSPVATIS